MARSLAPCPVIYDYGTAQAQMYFTINSANDMHNTQNVMVFRVPVPPSPTFTLAIRILGALSPLAADIMSMLINEFIYRPLHVTCAAAHFAAN